MPRLDRVACFAGGVAAWRLRAALTFAAGALPLAVVDFSAGDVAGVFFVDAFFAVAALDVADLLVVNLALAGVLPATALAPRARPGEAAFAFFVALGLALDFAVTDVPRDVTLRDVTWRDETGDDEALEEVAFFPVRLDV